MGAHTWSNRPPGSSSIFPTAAHGCCSRSGAAASAWISRRGDYLALARHQFEGAELAYVEARLEAGHGLAFLRLWTAKEALVKALGLGLGSLREVRLEIASDGALELATLPLVGGDPTCWRIAEYVPEHGYRAALAWQS